MVTSSLTLCGWMSRMSEGKLKTRCQTLIMPMERTMERREEDDFPSPSIEWFDARTRHRRHTKQSKFSTKYVSECNICWNQLIGLNRYRPNAKEHVPQNIVPISMTLCIDYEYRVYTQWLYLVKH